MCVCLKPQEVSIICSVTFHKLCHEGVMGEMDFILLVVISKCHETLMLSVCSIGKTRWKEHHLCDTQESLQNWEVTTSKDSPFQIWKT